MKIKLKDNRFDFESNEYVAWEDNLKMVIFLSKKDSSYLEKYINQLFRLSLKLHKAYKQESYFKEMELITD